MITAIILIGGWLLVATLVGLLMYLCGQPEYATFREAFNYGFCFTVGFPFAVVAGICYAGYRVFIFIAELICRKIW